MEVVKTEATVWGAVMHVKDEHSKGVWMLPSSWVAAAVGRETVRVRIDSGNCVPYVMDVEPRIACTDGGMEIRSLSGAFVSEHRFPVGTILAFDTKEFLGTLRMVTCKEFKAEGRFEIRESAPAATLMGFPVVFTEKLPGSRVCDAIDDSIEQEEPEVTVSDDGRIVEPLPESEQKIRSTYDAWMKAQEKQRRGQR